MDEPDHFLVLTLTVFSEMIIPWVGDAFMSISFYLEHLAGSCLVLFPIALMLFFPYEKERWRIRPLVRYILIAALGVVSAVYPFWASVRASGLYLALAILALIIAFFCLIRDSFTRKCATLFVSVFCLKAQAVLAIGYAAVRDLVSGAEAEYALVFNGGSVLMVFLGAVVLVPLIAVFERRILKPYLRSVSRRVMWLEILLLAVIDLVIFLLAFFFVGLFIAIASEINKVPVWFVIPGLFLFILALFAVYFVIFRTTLLQTREVEDRLQTELLRENSVSLQRAMEHSHEIYHDLRQLLRQLNAMSERGGFSELEPYIEKIVSLTEHTDTVFCENKCLNALFQYYTGYANENHITIRISAICGEVSVEDTDLTLLLANALENAINGAVEYQRQTGKDPEVSAFVGIIKHRLLIQITNRCITVNYSLDVAENEKHTLLSADAFLSTHEHSGHGLKRIDSIADKYQGTARFQFNAAKSLWTTRIAIPVRQ